MKPFTVYTYFIVRFTTFNIHRLTLTNIPELKLDKYNLPNSARTSDAKAFIAAKIEKI